MKYLMITTKSETVMNFRIGFIKYLVDLGHSVVVIANDNERQADIEQLGVKFYSVGGANRDTSVNKTLKYKKQIKDIILLEKPDKVLTYQTKPNTFGVLAAKSCGIKEIYPMIEGLGDVFINSGFKWRAIRFIVTKLYKKSFKKLKYVIFLNSDDKSEFEKSKIVNEKQSFLLNGVGVDTEKFYYSPTDNDKSFIMIARMLKTKGVFEYCEAAKIVKQRYPDAEFKYLGGEVTVKVSDIESYIDEGIVEYLGTVKDVRPYLEKITAMILPSYREGMPISIIEAESMGKPIITNNVAGCKDAVIDGYNGYLVNNCDVNEIAKCVIKMIENPQQTKQMGKNSRELVESKFDVNIINKIYGDLVGV